ncbi:uncharacterized protein LOC62_03G004076 [Vanrija pseudolonga]|uniref:Uncharacterized protein n=1 Tax=Vanrija pseudolonga TaxID=143232 RepID=A0AAF0YA16_9TREE|nr:hypothetical protein LOC62_03G004076 [Vanrija pseudolonga]
MPVRKKATVDPTFNAYDAAHKGLREHFEKVKCKGYKDKQALLTRGRKAFVALIGSKLPADSNVEPFCDWVENELAEIKDDVPCALYLAFHYAALETIHDELAVTLAESVATPNEPSTLLDSPEVALVRCGLLIAALIERQDTSGLSATAPDLHTAKWQKLLLSLLKAFLGGRLGGPDASSSVSDLLQEIATDKDNSIGRTLLVKDDGVVTLGELLYESTFSSLSVNLVRTIGAILPSGRRETFIDKAFADQPWSPEVVVGVKALLAEVKAQTGKVSPAMCKMIVNAIAAEEGVQRPRGFTLSKFIVNGEDKLDNDKCRRRLERHDIIVYFDRFAVVVKAYSEDGTEDESLFGVARIKSFKRATRGGDGSSDFIFQVGTETTVTLGMSDTEADAFEAVTSQLRRTRAEPEHPAPPPVEKELSPEEPGA